MFAQHLYIYSNVRFEPLCCRLNIVCWHLNLARFRPDNKSEVSRNVLINSDDFL